MRLTDVDVRQNVRSLQKQFDAAEAKLASAKIISEPDTRTEEGLPVTDIFEELDEDGNVICACLALKHPDSQLTTHS